MAIAKSIIFFVPGPPQNWQRAGVTASGVHYTPAKTRAYKRHVRACAALAMRGTTFGAARIAVEVEITYATKRRTDLDNAIKGLLDAMNGLVYVDDSQIDDLRVRRVAGEVGVTVRVYALEGSK